jgi:quinol monooxygenase YgiN
MKSARGWESPIRQTPHKRKVEAMIVLKITMNVMLDKQKELAQTLLSMMEPMEKAAGCLGCTLYCDIDDKSLLMLLGEWRTRKDLDHHLRSEIFGVLLGTKSLLKEPHGIYIYTINQVEGAEAVNIARGKNSI